ncbi:hypothetical protein FGB62_43g125 [Gracilaria domingensis]|nr:hypothetical protein FGB62_43g125 [Gracilaria domingensis]
MCGGRACHNVRGGGGAAAGRRRLTRRGSGEIGARAGGAPLWRKIGAALVRARGAFLMLKPPQQQRAQRAAVDEREGQHAERAAARARGHAEQQQRRERRHRAHVLPRRRAARAARRRRARRRRRRARAAAQHRRAERGARQQQPVHIAALDPEALHRHQRHAVRRRRHQRHFPPRHAPPHVVPRRQRVRRRRVRRRARQRARALPHLPLQPAAAPDDQHAQHEAQNGVGRVMRAHVDARERREARRAQDGQPQLDAAQRLRQQPLQLQRLRDEPREHHRAHDGARRERRRAVLADGQRAPDHPRPRPVDELLGHLAHDAQHQQHGRAQRGRDVVPQRVESGRRHERHLDGGEEGQPHTEYMYKPVGAALTERDHAIVKRGERSLQQGRKRQLKARARRQNEARADGRGRARGVVVALGRRAGGRRPLLLGSVHHRSWGARARSRRGNDQGGEGERGGEYMKWGAGGGGLGAGAGAGAG